MLKRCMYVLQDKVAKFSSPEYILQDPNVQKKQHDSDMRFLR